MLDRDAILAADDIVTEEVQVPEWAGSVYVRTLTGQERDHFEQAVQEANVRGKVDIRGLKVRLLVLTVCDEAGEPLFNDGDNVALNAKSGRAIDRLFQVAQRLSGLTAGDVDELLGNSGSDLSGSSGSG